MLVYPFPSIYSLSLRNIPTGNRLDLVLLVHLHYGLLDS
jgi:hypothetical protein